LILQTGMALSTCCFKCPIFSSVKTYCWCRMF